MYLKYAHFKIFVDLNHDQNKAHTLKSVCMSSVLKPIGTSFISSAPWVYLLMHGCRPPL
jgi:hypothetical protein